MGTPEHARCRDHRLRRRPHPTHAHLDRALEWIARLLLVLVGAVVFGAGFTMPGTNATPDPRLALRQSVLDTVKSDASRLQDRLGAADLTGDDAPLPPAPPPGGGVAFENLAPTPEPPSSLLKLAAGATAAAAAAAGYIWARRRNQHGISQ